MTMRDGLVEQTSKFRKRVASQDTSAYKVVRRGQLVVGFPIDEGVVAVQESHDEAIVSPAYGIWDIGKRVCGSFLERFLRSPIALHYYTTKLRGTTARRRSLPAEVFLMLDVPVPSLREQERVGNILDRVDLLRVKRRAYIRHVDDLARSIFTEMFGDLVYNSRSWSQGMISDLVAGFEGGKNLVAKDAADRDADYRVLKLSAVTSTRFDHSESKALPRGYVPPEAHLVREGDLLFGRANTRVLIGATALVAECPTNLALPDKIWRFVWHGEPRADPVYIWHLFLQAWFRREISRRATGTSGSMQNITKSNVLSIPVGLPPLALQREFVARIEIAKRVESACHVRGESLDELFASLQQRAFVGEL